MHARYLEAVINTEHVILGRRLRPYCLAYILFLELAENPLYAGGEVGWVDLQTAVLICSAEAEDLYGCRLEPRGLVARLRRCWWHWRSARKYNLATECEKFQAYLRDYNQGPDFWEEGGGGTLRSPMVLRVANFIEAHSNMTERDILTAPVGKMLWKSADLATMLGFSAAEIMTEEEEEIAAEVMAARAEAPTNG